MIKHKYPVVYNFNELHFKTKGLGEINNIVDGKIIKETEKGDYLEFTVSESCAVFEKLVKMNIVLAGGQLYRIWDTEHNTKTGEKDIFAKHIIEDANTWLLWKKKYKGTLQGIIRTMFLDIKENDYTYKVGWDMGPYKDIQLEIDIDKDYVIDAVMKAIKKFEEENPGVKIEIKRDNFSFYIYAFSESNMRSKAKERIADVHNCDYLNMRKGPSTKYSVITSVNRGETVAVLEKNSSNNWYKVRNKNDVIGWVNGGYLTNFREGEMTTKPVVTKYGLGIDTGIRIDTDKIENVAITEDINDFCTRLVAKGAQEGIEGTYNAPTGKQGFPFWIIHYMDFSEAKDQKQLKEMSLKYLEEKSLNIKNINVELLDIFGTDLYKNLKFYDNLKVYDWVWVKHPHIQAQYYQKFKIVKTERDMTTNTLLAVELGQLLPSFAKKLKNEIVKTARGIYNNNGSLSPVASTLEEVICDNDIEKFNIL